MFGNRNKNKGPLDKYLGNLYILSLNRAEYNPSRLIEDTIENLKIRAEEDYGEKIRIEEDDSISKGYAFEYANSKKLIARVLTLDEFRKQEIKGIAKRIENSRFTATRIN